MKVYNKIAPYYDMMIDWEERAKNEDPFFIHLFRERFVSSILDAGCGTGGHSLHWGEMGFNVVGIDSSRDMIEYANQKAAEREIDAEFQCMSMTGFASKLQQEFDLVACLGNTLPHLLEEEKVLKCFKDTAASLKPAGVAVFHLLNFQRILEFRIREFPAKTREAEGKEFLFLRFYDFFENVLEFNYVMAVRENGQWDFRSHQWMHKPWMREELVDMAREAGFKDVMCYGGFDFSEFNPDRSADLILVCDFGEE